MLGFKAKGIFKMVHSPGGGETYKSEITRKEDIKKGTQTDTWSSKFSLYVLGERGKKDNVKVANPAACDAQES